MRKIILCLAFLSQFVFGFTQTLIVTDNGSAVKFGIKNLGSTVTGKFTGIAGLITFNPANLATANFNVSIVSNTVFTDNGSRDKHLKKEEYFDVAKYPNLSFISTKITATNKAGSYIIDGNIIIKGVVKAISFPFNATAQANGLLFVGEFKLNRRDFKVGGNSWVLSDNLTVTLSLLAQKK